MRLQRVQRMICHGVCIDATVCNRNVAARFHNVKFDICEHMVKPELTRCCVESMADSFVLNASKAGEDKHI